MRKFLWLAALLFVACVPIQTITRVTPPQIGVNLYPPAPVATYLEALKQFPNIRVVQTGDPATARGMKAAGYTVGMFIWTIEGASSAIGNADFVYIGDEFNYYGTPQAYIDSAKPVIQRLRDLNYKGTIVSGAVGNIVKPLFGFEPIKLQQADTEWLLEFLRLENGIFDALSVNPFDGMMSVYRGILTANVPFRDIYHAGWAFQNPTGVDDFVRQLPFQAGAWKLEATVLKSWYQTKVSSLWCLGESGGGSFHPKAWGLINFDTMQLTAAGVAFKEATEGWYN